MSLTPKQQRVLQFIKDYSGRRGYAPSQWEIAKHFRLKSLGSIQDYLNALEAKGYLTKPWNGKRAIQLTDHGATAVRIPLAGLVAAGNPIEAIEQSESLEVPASLLKGGENFALKVTGESMIEEGIHDGDVVIVRKQETAKRGETAVAMVEGEATVKKFYPKRSCIELHPANAAMKPIVVTPDQEFKILGVVVGLIRKY